MLNKTPLSYLSSLQDAVAAKRQILCTSSAKIELDITYLEEELNRCLLQIFR